MPLSPVSQGIAVYTCSNPSCSLCEGDHSLLLDIVTPYLPPTEDCFPQEIKDTRNIYNVKCEDDIIFSELYSTSCEEERPKDKENSAKRKLSGHVGYATKSRQHSIGTKLFNDDVDDVDDSQLMNLAIELELDKEHCLPDLQKDIITELTQ